MRSVVLAMLASGPAHGYELTRRYDELFAGIFGPVNVGQVYVVLGRLERDGLVVHHREPQPKGADRKVFELTALGHKALTTWLEEDTELPVAKSDLVLRLLAAGLVGSPEPLSVVAAHRQRCLEALRVLDRQAADAARDDRADRVDRFDLAELLLQGAALRLQAELRWLDLCDQRLRAGKDSR
jgi:DNA-binding PadR family transcriptional regulator